MQGLDREPAMIPASPKDASRTTGAGSIFLEMTKYANTKVSDQQKGLKQPPLEIPPDPDLPLLNLPQPKTLSIPAFDLRIAIARRRSI